MNTCSLVVSEPTMLSLIVSMMMHSMDINVLVAWRFKYQRGITSSNQITHNGNGVIRWLDVVNCTLRRHLWYVPWIVDTMLEVTTRANLPWDWQDSSVDRVKRIVSITRWLPKLPPRTWNPCLDYANARHCSPVPQIGMDQFTFVIVVLFWTMAFLIIIIAVMYLQIYSRF